MDDNKSKALAAALAQIERQFGKGAIMKMGENQIENDLQVVSTGSLGLDLGLGVRLQQIGLARVVAAELLQLVERFLLLHG